MLNCKFTTIISTSQFYEKKGEGLYIQYDNITLQDCYIYHGQLKIYVNSFSNDHLSIHRKYFNQTEVNTEVTILIFLCKSYLEGYLRIVTIVMSIVEMTKKLLCFTSIKVLATSPSPLAEQIINEQRRKRIETPFPIILCVVGAIQT